MTKHIGYLSSFLYSKNLIFLETCILAVFLLGIYLDRLEAVECQPDETFWIVSSVRLDKFIAGDFDSPIWIEHPLISFEVRPIPSYMVAVSQRLSGIHEDDLPVYWEWELSPEENISRDAMPEDDVLWWSRLPMVLISVFSLAGVSFLLAKSHSRLAAYVFGFVSINEYFLLHLRRAMSEAALLFFTVLTFYTVYKLFYAIRGKSIKGIMLWSIIAGTFSGLAGQSKLTGLACAAIALLGSLYIIFESRGVSLPKRVIMFLQVTLVVMITSSLVFLASYPFFYNNTIHRILTTFYIRGQVVEAQIKTYPDQIIRPDQRPGILFKRVFDYPLNFGLRGRGGLVVHWVNFLVGGFGLFYSIFQLWRKNRGYEHFLILILGVITCAVPMLFVPLDWDRYYLYPIFFSCMFFAIGLSQFCAVFFNTIARRIYIPQPEM